MLYQLANIYNDYYLDKSVALAHYEKAAESSIHPEIDKYIKYKIHTLKENGSALPQTKANPASC